MYEWHDSLFGSYLALKDVNGRKRKIHVPFFSGFAQGRIQGILDSQLASRGRAIELKVPIHELGLRLARHDSATPTVEMEPNVRYRYVNPDLLKIWATAGNWWMLPLLIPIPWVMIIAKSITHSLETGLLIAAAYAIPVVGYVVYRQIKTARFLRHFDDRFILRDGRLYVIQDGVERSLPPGKASGRRLQGHGFLRHGEGRSAYEMAPQFLEPDV
jgi:hypothetical protein